VSISGWRRSSRHKERRCNRARSRLFCRPHCEMNRRRWHSEDIAAGADFVRFRVGVIGYGRALSPLFGDRLVGARTVAGAVLMVVLVATANSDWLFGC
jgi:hypothetical protein